MNEQVNRYQQVHQATVVTAVVHVLIGLAKVIFGIVGHSQALVADGIHSFADLLTDGLVIVAARIGAQAADEDHPYGHARIETAVAVGLSIVLLSVGLVILVDAIVHLTFSSLVLQPKPVVMLIALLSVVANEGLFHYLIRIADRSQSQLLRTNAWHCRSDAASSLVVLVGVVGAYFGFPQLDPLAAIVVSLLIVKMAWDLGWPCVRELVDTGIEPDRLQRIQTIIQETPGVDALHQLRTRSMAGNIYVDVHVLVEPHVSVSEGHYIGELVRARLLSQMKQVEDVTVHVDPEDDELVPTSQHLPTRQALLASLTEHWQRYPGFDQIEQFRLHYLAGFVLIELHFPKDCFAVEQISEVLAQYQTITQQLDYVAKVTIHLVAS